MAKIERTPDQKRQRFLLFLLVLLVLFLGYRRAGSWFSFGGDSFLGGQRTADFSSVVSTEVEGLALDRLEAQAQEIEVGRSPWQFGRLPPPPPRPVVRQPPPVVRQPVREEPKPQGPPPPPPPPPIDVEFLGSLGPEWRKVAVFGKDELVINALEGDLVNEKFRVHSIGLESVDLTFEGFPDVPPERLALKKK